MKVYLHNRPISLLPTIFEKTNIRFFKTNATSGVPQCSILGHRLCIIYTNHIANSSKHFDFIIYSDDTTLSTTIEIIYRDKNNNTI